MCRSLGPLAGWWATATVRRAEHPASGMATGVRHLQKWAVSRAELGRYASRRAPTARSAAARGGSGRFLGRVQLGGGAVAAGGGRTAGRSRSRSHPARHRAAPGRRPPRGRRIRPSNVPRRLGGPPRRNRRPRSHTRTGPSAARPARRRAHRSSLALFAGSTFERGPSTPLYRALRTPGRPPSASTSIPLSSAMTVRPVCSRVAAGLDHRVALEGVGGLLGLHEVPGDGRVQRGEGVPGGGPLAQDRPQLHELVRVGGPRAASSSRGSRRGGAQKRPPGRGRPLVFGIAEPGVGSGPHAGSHAGLFLDLLHCLGLTGVGVAFLGDVRRPS